MAGLAGCASPGPWEHAAAATDHSQQARDELALAQQEEAASRLLAAQGDTDGAAITHQGAEDDWREARHHQFKADLDSWLSKWWPEPIFRPD
jgi:hypothetical protein